MRIILSVDQLRIDPNFVARAPHAPFKHVAHAQLAADLLGVDRLISIGKGSIARDHRQVREPRQIGR